MQKLILAAAALTLWSCATPAPRVAEPLPPPVIAPKPPSEPFGALLEARKNPASVDIYGTERVTRQQFKDHFLHGFSAADRLDGKMDGSAPIAESCKELLELCKAADTDHDGKLSLTEFLVKLDELFDRADTNRDHTLRRRELENLEY